MILATQKRLRSIFLTLLLLIILGTALLCQPLPISNAAGATEATSISDVTDITDGTDITDIINTVISLLKCYVGSCGMESQNQ